jgi:hypothetical protein
MKFITRALYQEMQGVPEARWDEANAKWRRACDARQTEFCQIKSRLPAGMRAFAEKTFHDGVVSAVSQPSATELDLDIDASRNPWGPIGKFKIKFTGVREVEGIANLIGDDWLYEEVHLHPVGGFDYRVLFWRSDFRVVADEVEVEELD